MLAAAVGALLLPAAALAQTAPAAAPAPAAPAAEAAPAAPPAAAIPASPNLVVAGDAIGTLKGNPHFSILVKVLDAAQLSALFSQHPGLTVFAPTDEAFNLLTPAQVAALTNADNVNLARSVLVNHIVNLPLDSSKLKGAKGSVPSVGGGNLDLDGSGDTIKINGADVIQADVKASDALIHVVDKVLVPAGVTLP